MTSERDAIDIKDITGYVMVGNGEKCASSRVAKYILEEDTTRIQINEMK
jgi:hypothetical protein